MSPTDIVCVTFTGRNEVEASKKAKNFVDNLPVDIEVVGLPPTHTKGVCVVQMCLARKIAKPKRQSEETR
jgi:hypothetical protein